MNLYTTILEHADIVTCLIVQLCDGFLFKDIVCNDRVL